MPTLLEIIAPRINLNLSRRPGEGTKMVRHKDPRWDVAGLPEDDLRVYQSFQDWKIFECDYIIVFIGRGRDQEPSGRCVRRRAAQIGP